TRSAAAGAGRGCVWNRSIGLAPRPEGTRMVSSHTLPASSATRVAPTPPVSAYLVFDTESVPDGQLLSLVKYPEQDVTPVDAIERAREEARRQSSRGSDFIPVAFQYPVATCVLRAGADFTLQAITCLDA